VGVTLLLVLLLESGYSQGMSDFSKQWNTEMAMEVLASQDVDGVLWSEAVKWLLLYGPPQIKELLGRASSFAFSEYFPEVQAKGYGDDGQPFYDLHDIARSLGVEAGEVAAKLAELQFEEGVEVFVEGDRVYTVH
jgi:hypothetical protein